MKYLIIDDEKLKSEYPADCGNIKYRTNAVEATPENIAKLNLIPKKERKPFAVGDKIKFCGPVYARNSFLTYVEHSAEIVDIKQKAVLKIKYFSNLDGVDMTGEISCRQTTKRIRTKQREKSVKVTVKKLEDAWKRAASFCGVFSVSMLEKELGL